MDPKRINGRVISLDDARDDIAYPISDILVHTIDHVPVRPLAKPHRCAVLYDRLYSSIGFHGELGGEFKPTTSGILTIRVLFPPASLDPNPFRTHDDQLMIRMLDLVADWLIVHSLARIKEIVNLGSGELQIDRIGIHPVDSNPTAFELFVIPTVLHLLACDWDNPSDEAIQHIPYTIKSLTNEAIPGLIRALAHERPGVKKLAARAMEHLGTPEALEALKAHP